MGDEAQLAFQIWAQENHIDCEQYGLDRPNIPRVWELPLFIRATPDFLCSGTTKFLVEVKGTGRDGILKIKKEAVEGMAMWNIILPLWLFVWNTHTRQVAFTTYNYLNNACQKSPINHFNDPKKSEYYALPHKYFPWNEFAALKGGVPSD